MKLLLTGWPEDDRRSLVRTLVAEDAAAVSGFFRVPHLEEDECVGFAVRVIGSFGVIFAHTDFAGSCRVDQFGVDVKVFEDCVLPVIEAASRGGRTLFMDQLGIMELLSARFRSAVLEVLDSECSLVATTTSQPHSFVELLCGRPDVELVPPVLPDDESRLDRILARIRSP